MEIWRAFGDPCHEAGQPGMGTQRLNRIEVTGQLGFGQGGVNFVVADLVQQHRRPTLPAAQLGRQMMQGLLGMGRDWAAANRADRGVL